jgi:two-component system response regulator DesR
LENAIREACKDGTFHEALSREKRVLLLRGEEEEVSFAVVAVAFPEDRPLTEREVQVGELLGEGKTTQEIAEELGISNLTAQGYKKQIQIKLGARNSTVLTQWALIACTSQHRQR